MDSSAFYWKQNQTRKKSRSVKCGQTVRLYATVKVFILISISFRYRKLHIGIGRKIGRSVGTSTNLIEQTILLLNILNKYKTNVLCFFFG